MTNGGGGVKIPLPKKHDIINEQSLTFFIRILNLKLPPQKTKTIENMRNKQIRLDLKQNSPSSFARCTVRWQTYTICGTFHGSFLKHFISFMII